MNPRQDQAVRVLRRAVRGRRLSRRQAATLDQLLSIVANEDASLQGMAFTSGREAGR